MKAKEDAQQFFKLYEKMEEIEASSNNTTFGEKVKNVFEDSKEWFKRKS